MKTLSKIGWEGGRSTSIWIMSLNILVFFLDYPLLTFSLKFYCFLVFFSLFNKIKQAVASSVTDLNRESLGFVSLRLVYNKFN